MKVILMIDATRPALSSVETVDRYLDMIDYLWKQDELDYITTLQQLTDSLFQIIMDDGMSIDGHHWEYQLFIYLLSIQKDSLQNEIIDHGSLGLLLDILEDTRIRAEEDEKENYDDILKTVNRIAVYAVSTGKSIYIS